MRFEIDNKFRRTMNLAFRKALKNSTEVTFDCAYDTISTYKTFDGLESFVEDFLIDFICDLREGLENETYTLEYNTDGVLVAIIKIDNEEDECEKIKYNLSAMEIINLCDSMEGVNAYPNEKGYSEKISVLNNRLGLNYSLVVPYKTYIDDLIDSMMIISPEGKFQYKEF